MTGSLPIVSVAEQALGLVEPLQEQLAPAAAQRVVQLQVRPAVRERFCVAVHRGDVRLNNLGLADDRLVLVDWGERTGTAPAPVELASFLVFDARRFDVPKDQVVADARALYIGGLVQLGCNFALPIALGKGDAARAVALAELDWWVPRVTAALENQSL